MALLVDQCRSPPPPPPSGQFSFPSSQGGEGKGRGWDRPCGCDSVGDHKSAQDEEEEEEEGQQKAAQGRPLLVGQRPRESSVRSLMFYYSPLVGGGGRGATNRTDSLSLSGPPWSPAS